MVGGARSNVISSNINPNVAYPRRGKTRQSEPNVGARRLGQDEQYLTVREILSEVSTLADGALSRERSDFYRFGYASLGSIPLIFRLQSPSAFRMVGYIV